MNKFNLPYRKGICVFLFRDSSLLIVKKKSEDGAYWHLPQGGIKKGENPEDAVYRELEEELNLGKQDIKIIKKSIHTRKYDWPEEDRQKLGFAGQEQSVWIVKLLESGNLKHNPEEILGFKFINLEEVDNYIRFEDLKDLIKKVEKELSKHNALYSFQPES